MEDPKKQLTNRLIQLLEGLFTQVRPPISGEGSAPDLTMPQLKTLRLLSQGPQRMSDVASYLGVTLSSATSMIDRLVSKGLVERARDPEDRRVVTCRLSPLGREQVDRFWRIHRRNVELLAEALSPEDLGTVVRAMELIAGFLRKQVAKPSSHASETHGGGHKGSPGPSDGP